MTKPKLTFFGRPIARKSKRDRPADIKEEAYGDFTLGGERCYVSVYDRSYGATVATLNMGFGGNDQVMVNGARSCEAGLAELEERALQRFKMLGELLDYDVED